MFEKKNTQNKMSGLTGNRDLDMEIILKLEDRELGLVCQANSYVRNICNDPAFWYKKIIEKIDKSKERSVKLDKRIKPKEIQGKELDSMKDIFGFSDLKELYLFLKELPQDSLYLLYLSYPGVLKIIDFAYTFDEEKLPKYINLKEAIYYLRREIIKSYFRQTTGASMEIPALEYINDNMPGYKRKYKSINMTGEDYNRLKLLGIRTDEARVQAPIPLPPFAPH